MVRPILGVIGGSGLYDLPGLAVEREERVATPWGEPSDALRFGRVGDTQCVFLARHGRGHRHAPGSINYRANFDALKRVGVTDVIAMSACGSYREDLPPGTFVIVDQFVDRTYARETSFFGAGCVAHVPMARPVSPGLARRLAAAAAHEGVPHHFGGTYVCMEGPQFATMAEAHANRANGWHVVGQTAGSEARLAREAELPYALCAMVTDFDCWSEAHASVDVATVVRTARENAGKANRLLVRALLGFGAEREPCPVADHALDGAIMTSPDARDPALLAKLDAVAGRVLRG